MADPSGSVSCTVTTVRHDIHVNELLCFIGHKSKIMPNSQLSKLSCDFYDGLSIQPAKKVLMMSVSLPEGEKRKSRRRSKIADTNMPDSITIFY